jgi:nuclear pore complex protein Nup50
LSFTEISNEKTSNSSVKTANSDSAYMTQLKRLNQEVCEWIKKHINENPYVDLSPIFKDYEKHLLNLEKKFPAVSKPAGLNEIASTKVTTLSTANVQAVRGLSSSVGMPTLNGSKFWSRCLIKPVSH